MKATGISLFRMTFIAVVALVVLLAGMPTHAFAVDDIKVVNLVTKDLVYDPFTQTIYASVPSSGGPMGNSITPIDPLTGDVGSSVFVGSEPGKLAISDDGMFIYASLDGAAAVRQFVIPTHTAELQFSLGSDPFFGPYFVEDMQVLPGFSDSVAISRKYEGVSPKHAGVAIYDNGIQRPATTPTHTGSNVIQFSSDASRLYGYNNESTEFGFRRMAVDDSGVTVVSTTPNLIQGFNVDIRFDGGLIYATTGRVIDPEALTIVGTFPNIPLGSLVAPDSTVGLVFFLTGSAPTVTLRAFDLVTFLQVGTVDIPGVVGTYSSLIRWGADGLAFRTSGNQVFLIRTSLIPAP
jgi:hypothetical protein